MRVAGLEPARYRYRGILSPLCLPIPPYPPKIKLAVLPEASPDFWRDAARDTVNEQN